MQREGADGPDIAIGVRHKVSNHGHGASPSSLVIPFFLARGLLAGSGKAMGSASRSFRAFLKAWSPCRNPSIMKGTSSATGSSAP